MKQRNTLRIDFDRGVYTVTVNRRPIGAGRLFREALVICAKLLNKWDLLLRFDRGEWVGSIFYIR
jgi:hypothetical protein